MGGDNSGGSTQTNVYKTPEQTALLNKLASVYGNQIGVNNVYEGLRVAPFSDLQQNVLNTVSGYSNTGLPLTGNINQAASDLLTGNAGATPMTDKDVEDYFNSVYRDPAMLSLKQDINPAIDEAFAGPGFFSSARSQARTKAATDVGNWLGEQRGQLNWDMLKNNQALEESKAARALSALPASMQANNIGLETAKTLFGFGSLQQTQQQQELSASFDKFLEQNQITDPTTISILLSIIGQNVGTVSETEPNSWGSEQWGSLLLKGAAGAALGATGIGGLSVGMGTGLGLLSGIS